jgi:regulator of cell morphogenesis and NO signaling
MGSSNDKNTINYSEMRVDKLVEYLSTTHHSSIKCAISRFNVYLKTIIKVDRPIHPEVHKISILIQELANLMETHLALEEHLLFPYITNLSKNIELLGTKDAHLSENPIKKIKQEHLSMRSLLENIRKISNNFLPSVNSSPALKLCYAQLFDFEQDVHKHIFLEEKILFPKLTNMENRIKDQTQKIENKIR